MAETSKGMQWRTLENLFHLYDDLRRCRKSGHIEQCGPARHLDADGVKKLDDFMKFWKGFRERRMMYPVITREQGTAFIDYLHYFGVRFEDDGKRISVLESEDDGYEGRNYYCYFFYKDGFTCKKCGAVVEPFKQACDDCMKSEELREFDTVI